jgi:alpha-galactosidase
MNQKLRRAWLLILLTAGVSLPSAAPDLTARWVARAPNGDGTFRETVFVFNQRGATLTGSVINPTSEQPFEGSYGHEVDDARTYAEWGIDYLKYDWCGAARLYADSDMPAVYQKMGDALRATGRPIVYSLCQYGRHDVWTWGADVGGNLWRTTGDIADNWESMSRIGFSQDEHGPFAKPGHWNDPDMLEIGNGGMTDTEYRTHMSLWSLLSAPLLAGNDLRSVSPEILGILTNREVIAIDQDPLGRQARRVTADGEIEIWTKQLAGGATAVGVFNRRAAAAEVTIRCGDLQLCGGTVRDLWAHADAGALGPTRAVSVPSHGVVLFKIGKLG